VIGGPEAAHPLMGDDPLELGDPRVHLGERFLGSRISMHSGGEKLTPLGLAQSAQRGDGAKGKAEFFHDRGISSALYCRGGATREVVIPSTY